MTIQRTTQKYFQTSITILYEYNDLMTRSVMMQVQVWNTVDEFMVMRCIVLCTDAVGGEGGGGGNGNTNDATNCGSYWCVSNTPRGNYLHHIYPDPAKDTRLLIRSCCRVYGIQTAGQHDVGSQVRILVSSMKFCRTKKDLVNSNDSPLLKSRLKQFTLILYLASFIFSHELALWNRLN